jgi:hypothetical protein
MINLTISQRFKMGLALVIDGDSDQTVPFIASQKCVEAAGTGMGASYNGKRMIASCQWDRVLSVQRWSLLVSVTC